MPNLGAKRSVCEFYFPHRSPAVRPTPRARRREVAAGDRGGSSGPPRPEGSLFRPTGQVLRRRSAGLRQVRYSESPGRCRAQCMREARHSLAGYAGPRSELGARASHGPGAAGDEARIRLHHRQRRYGVVRPGGERDSGPIAGRGPERRARCGSSEDRMGRARQERRRARQVGLRRHHASPRGGTERRRAAGGGGCRAEAAGTQGRHAGRLRGRHRPRRLPLAWRRRGAAWALQLAPPSWARP
jgi:hypothetical protein